MKNYIIAALVGALVAVAGVAMFDVFDNQNEGVNNQSQIENSSQTLSDITQADGKSQSLANSGLESVPMSTFEDSSITNLDVSGNNLTGALPAEIRKLKNLTRLDASDNDLTGIPAEIGQLNKLEYIDFSDNDISGLPLEIGNLKNLETLDLRGNPNVSDYDLGLIKKDIPQAQILID